MARWSAPRRDRLSRSSTACCTSAVREGDRPGGPVLGEHALADGGVHAVEHLVAGEAAGAGEDRDGGVGSGDRGRARRGAPSGRPAGRGGRRGRCGSSRATPSSGAAPWSRELRHEERVAPGGPVDGLGPGPAVPAAGREQLGDVAGFEPADGEPVEEPVAVEVGAELLEVRGSRSAAPSSRWRRAARGPVRSWRSTWSSSRRDSSSVRWRSSSTKTSGQTDGLGLEQVGHRLEQHVALGADLGSDDLHAGDDLGEVGHEQGERVPALDHPVLRFGGHRSAARPAAPRRSARTGRSPRWSPGPTSRWRPRVRLLDEPADQPGLAGAGVAGDDDHPALPGACRRPGSRGAWPARRPARRTAGRGGARGGGQAHRDAGGGPAGALGSAATGAADRRHGIGRRSCSARQSQLVVAEDRRLQPSSSGPGSRPSSSTRRSRVRSKVRSASTWRPER